MKRVIFIMAVLCLAPTVGYAQDWWEDEFEEYPPISLELNAWVSQLQGNVRWDGDGNTGSEIDFRENTGLTSSSAGPYIRLNIGLSDQWTLRFNFWSTAHETTQMLNEPIRFGGSTFPAGPEIRTRFSMDSYAALLDYKFLDGEQVDVSLLFGAAVYKARMEMENMNTLEIVEQCATIPTPVLGAEMKIDFTETVAVRGRIYGMALNVDDTVGQAVDAEAALQWTIADGLYVVGGYKMFKADVEFDTTDDVNFQPNKGDFKLQGPFFGVGILF